METNIFQGRISDLKIEEIDDMHAARKYIHSFKINEKEFHLEALRDLYISNTHYLIVKAESGGKVIALYNVINDEKHGKKWQQLKKLKPKKLQTLFHFKEGVVEQKQFVQERLHNSQRKYAGTLKYYNLKINGDMFIIGHQEGKRITPGDKIAFLHPENKDGVTVFHNFTNSQNTLTIFPVDIITYSILAICSLVGGFLLTLSNDKALKFSLGIVCGIFFLTSVLCFLYIIWSRNFQKKRMQELMKHINEKN